MTKSTLHLSIDSSLLEKARSSNGFNISNFLETALRQELEDISVEEYNIFLKFFAIHGYLQSDEVKLTGINYIVVRGLLKMLISQNSFESIINNIEDVRIDKKGLLEFVLNQVKSRRV